MILERVRESCARVAARARQVRIVTSAIPPLAADLVREPMPLPGLDPKTHHLDSGAETAAFILTLDAVNFGSGFFAHLRPFAGHEGYFAVAAALRREFRENGALSAERLAGISFAECVRLFGQDDGNPAMTRLLDLFRQALNQLGRHLLERFDGSATALIDAAEGSAGRLVELLLAMPFYRDFAFYEDFEVAFLKRAQITAGDLALAFSGESWGTFHDLDRLTIFADNMVPHVLRLDGILEYEPGLAARIDRRETLAAGGPEEVEIRACALHAAEGLVAELQRRGRKVDARRLDYYLWNRGLEERDAAVPPHATPSVYY